MFIDNVNIVTGQDHLQISTSLVSQISVQSVAEAENATNVLALAIEQTGGVQAQIGAIINRYQSAIEGAAMRGMDMREARSRISEMLNMLRRLQSLQSNKYWHKPPWRCCLKQMRRKMLY